MRRFPTARSWAPAAVAVGLAVGCASAPALRPTGALPIELAGYLPDPSAWAPPELAANVAAVHERLLAGAAFDELRRDLDRLSNGPGATGVFALLRAQVDFVHADYEVAAVRLEGLAPTIGGTVPARLLAARVAELRGRAADAFVLYDLLASESTLAATRRDAVRGAATRERTERVEAALAAHDGTRAARELEQLERVDAQRGGTLALAARVAELLGDRPAEMAAVRALAAAKPGDRELQLRRGILEIEVGDAAAGLALLGRIADEHPDDAEVSAALVRGRFLFRLANAPESVRAIAGRSQLSRAELAQLLYWLVPSVRTARPAAARIAADSLDHPALEAIVRVANLGLMPIDEALHAFEPNRPLARLDAFLALARLRGAPAAGRADGCGFAFVAGWIESVAACLPAAPVSGAEAVEWLRRSGAAESEE